MIQYVSGRGIEKEAAQAMECNGPAKDLILTEAENAFYFMKLREERENSLKNIIIGDSRNKNKK